MDNLHVVETEDSWFLFYKDPINGEHFKISKEDAENILKMKGC